MGKVGPPLNIMKKEHQNWEKRGRPYYMGLTQIFPEDYYETVTRWTLTRRAVQTLRWLERCPLVAAHVLYVYEELYSAARASSHRRTRFGKHSLQSDLDNLWRCGKIKKFAMGYYLKSGRPYGIRWSFGPERERESTLRLYHGLWRESNP